MKHLEDSIKTLKGIGDKLKNLYEKLSIFSLWDLLFYYPRTYFEYPMPIDECSQISDGETVALRIQVHESCKNNKTRRMEITTLNTFCGETPIQMIWFRSPYIKNQIQLHETYIFYGVIKSDGYSRKKMEQPILYTEEKYEKELSTLQPIYGLTKGLTNNQVKKNLHSLLEEDTFLEFLPEKYIHKRNLESFSHSIKQIHFPDSFEELRNARNRLVYDEFLTFFLNMEKMKENEEAIINHFSFSKEDYYKKCLQRLPFELTEGQKSCLEEIKSDFQGEFISQRLIQGDVGSGKTIIAFLLMTLVVENGYQAAIMAPTEILARQHYETFCNYIKSFELPFEAVFLTGSFTAAQKRKIYEKLSSEEPIFIIGTNALIQEKANYDNLALVITDEQHRFGVKQRDTFRKKGNMPFTLVMSATPIPRTLSMILYGDMNISVISDVPAKRLPIKNAVIKPKEVEEAYRFIYRQIHEGRQAYVICPLVEASEKTESENVLDYGKKLREYYKGSVSVGVLHGRMSADEKQSVMEDFLNKNIDILVSTTVVEVGVNVPNATVMLIENANRFGLAQLHQLRGRVGRGEWQSYCMFVDSSKEEKNKRLEVISKSNDGFYVASEDLKLRGPGDFYGIRQSGEFDFSLADIYQDGNLMQYASEDAKEIIKDDPSLSKEEHKALKDFLLQLSSHQYTNL
ncbi:MAG: ATP-dependent DNA helicase RecG [Lachnospiraceae bacterium]|nr:ATP-dependent DNA helicase RecG [Lachnospiraceae bacterium]